MTDINVLALFGIEITELEIYEQTDSGESRESATAISSSGMDETAVLSDTKNPFRPLGGVSGEGLSPNNQARAASQPSLIVWRDDYTIGSAIHHLLVYLGLCIIMLEYLSYWDSARNPRVPYTECLFHRTKERNNP